MTIEWSYDVKANKFRPVGYRVALHDSSEGWYGYALAYTPGPPRKSMDALTRVTDTHGSKPRRTPAAALRAIARDIEESLK